MRKCLYLHLKKDELILLQHGDIDCRGLSWIHHKVMPEILALDDKAVQEEKDNAVGSACVLFFFTSDAKSRME